VAVVAALLWVAVIAYLFAPWLGFIPERADDSDVTAWQEGYRSVAIMWVIASVMACLGAVRAFWPRRRSDPPHQKPDNSEPVADSGGR